MKKALISGITGQDGSFLAEFLLQKGYEVHGILRRSSSFNTGRIEHLYFDEWVRDMKQKRTINLHYGDMTDSSSLIRIIQSVQPDEIYNLAAQSHVKSAGSAAKRNDPVLSPQPLWRSQTVWLLDYKELPRKLWHVCCKRHTLQPRERTPR